MIDPAVPIHVLFALFMNTQSAHQDACVLRRRSLNFFIIYMVIFSDQLMKHIHVAAPEALSCTNHNS